MLVIGIAVLVEETFTIMPKTDRRDFLKKVGLGAAALAMPGCASLDRPRPKKPNILVLFTDDQRFDTLHSVNCPEIKTPNLDRLVQSGTTFTRAHISGGTSGAVCMPSRAMLLTGRNLFHLQDRGGQIPMEHAMFPEAFRDAGYKTFGTGKWHNGRQAYARCFTHGGNIFFGGMSDHLKVPVHDFDEFGAYDRKDRYIADGFSSVLFADEAVHFLEKDSFGAPFLMYVSFTAPHDPRMAPEEYNALYPPDSVSLPESFMPEHPFDNGEMNIRDENLAPRPRTPEVVRAHKAAYYAMITHTDAQVGRILDALEEAGELDDTIIVFAGDNGLAVGRHGLMGKQNLYDHSVRVPLIMSGPGIPRNAQARGLCCLQDLFPTLCALSGLEVPATVEGRNLVSMLEDPSHAGRDSMFLAYRHLQRGVRTDDDWKLIEYNVRGERTTQLFDTIADPHELADLSADPQHAGRLQEMRALLVKHMREQDDFCDLEKPNWGLAESVEKKRRVKHHAVGKKITFAEPYSPKYKAAGDGTLLDGERGTSDFRDGAWQGFESCDLDAVIDLGELRKVNKVKAGFLRCQASWIFLPLFLEIGLSEDGRDYRVLMRVPGERLVENPREEVKDFSTTFGGFEARYVRVRAVSIGKCPAWHAGAGGKAWLFADEIVVK